MSGLDLNEENFDLFSLTEKSRSHIMTGERFAGMS